MMSLYNRKGVESTVLLAMQGMEQEFKNRGGEACTTVSGPDHTISQLGCGALSCTLHALGCKHACCRECLEKLPAKGEKLHDRVACLGCAGVLS